MTTIATDGKSMAADSLTTSNTLVTRHAAKVCQLKDGRVFGYSGLTVDCLKARRFLDEGGEQPKTGSEWCGLLLNHDGTVDYIDEGFELIRYMLPAAIGSGGELALGAMLAGKNPTDAVKIAAQRDRNTGGPIVALIAEQPELRKVA